MISSAIKLEKSIKFVKTHLKKKHIMSATMTAPLKQASQLMHKFSLPANKSISGYKQAIYLITDKKSVKNSVQLLKELKGIINSELNKNVDNGEININAVNANIKNTEKLLLNINEFFHQIDSLFDGNEAVIIDDNNTKLLMQNFKDAKEIVIVLLDYLDIITVINSYKKETLKKYDLDNIDGLFVA